MFQIQGLFKFVEKDSWKDGCDPATGSSYMIDVNFHGKTADEVVKKAAAWLGIDENGIERNACDEPGRVDFARTENDNGNEASKREIAAWKEGKISLWYAVYTGTVEKVEPVTL